MSRQQWPSCQYGAHNDYASVIKEYSRLQVSPGAGPILTVNNLKPTESSVDSH